MDGLLGPYFGNPNIQRQAAKARALSKQRDVNLLPDPKTYAVVQGLLGTAPDELGFSVLHPQYQAIRQVADPAFAVGTLLGVAPAPTKAIEKGAMAAGRAGERLAERVVPQIMERGGMPAGLLEGMSSRTVSPLTVYHGSPAKFERFDPTKIGSGEGAQAYGYGHYVAESPAVAKEYQTRLSSQKNTLTDEQNLRDSLSSELRGVVQQISSLKPTVSYSSGAAKKIEELSAKENILRKEIDKLTKIADEQLAGSFYEIDLPDEQIARMLDFDKPLMQQSKEIQSLAKQYGLTDADHMGGDLIAAMDAKRPAGAEMMRQAGVPGIRYLDQGSRPTSGGQLIDVFETPNGWKSKVKVTNRGGTQFQSPSDIITTSMPFKTKEEATNWANEKIGSGTSNFVVFPGNEDLLTILKRNGGLLGP